MARGSKNSWERSVLAGCALVIGWGCAPDEDAGLPAATETASGSSDDAPLDSQPDVPTPATDDESGSDDGEAPQQPPAACSAGFAIPPSEQAPGDPVAGRYALLNEGYVTCGIPAALFPALMPLLGSFAEGASLPGRSDRNAGLPHNWTIHTAQSGAEIASLNCLECHAGEFNGELVLGLGKHDADYTENLAGLFGNLPIPEIPIAGLSEMTELVRRYQALGPELRMYTVGTNPADKLAAVLASHRNPVTLAWSDEAHTEVPSIVVPVDTPPWWRVAKKHGLFYNGMSRGDHRGTMMFASSLCTDSVGEAEAILSYFNNIRAFLASLQAPAYPFEIDPTLADRGRDLFVRDCSCCHGTYDEDPSAETYPNLLLPLAVIGTDPLLAAQTAELPYVDWYNVSWYAMLGALAPDDPFPGYVAPPLDGIWATAPYFHNASVPTLELVLDSEARPEVWRRVDYDSTNFDRDALGWPYQVSPVGRDQAPPDQRKHLYDTNLLGHWNTGHTFGDHLTDDERAAVLEYLKTL